MGANSDLKVVLGEWLIAAVVLSATFPVVSATSAFLKMLHKNHRLPILGELAPSIANLLYVLGLKLAADFAPLRGKVELWVEGGIYVVAVFIFLKLVQKAALIGIKWGTQREGNPLLLEQGFTPLLRNVVTLFVFLSGSIMILKHFNYDVLSLLTALGVGSLAVGLAAKDTLSHMISGFVLIIDRNLKPGDKVNLSGSIGDVQEIGLRSTQIKLGDGNILIVPNSELVNTRILNLCLPNRETNCTTLIRIPLSISFNKAKNICLDVIKQIEKVTLEKPPAVYLLSLTDGCQLVQICFWVKDLNFTTAALSDFHEKLLEKLEHENIPLLAPLGISRLPNA